jgi:uncharacterized protein YgbK (DUF1537 family)
MTVEAALGCVADDYTGGTDVASALRREGLVTLLLFGPPRPDWSAGDADAVVVALKSRNLPPADAVDDRDLAAIAAACRDLPVVTGAAGLVRHLANLTCESTTPRSEAPRRGSVAEGEAGRSRLSTAPAAERLPGGPVLILAGSSSTVTLEQVARARARYPSVRLDPAAIPDPGDLRAKAVDWMGRHLERGEEDP